MATKIVLVDSLRVIFLLNYSRRLSTLLIKLQFCFLMPLQKNILRLIYLLFFLQGLGGINFENPSFFIIDTPGKNSTDVCILKLKNKTMNNLCIQLRGSAKKSTYS